MINILREFYFGNVSPREQLEPNTQVHGDSIIDMNGCIKKISEKLPESDKFLLEELMWAHDGIRSEEANAAFSDGFTLGSLFILEVFQKGERYNYEYTSE